MAKSILARTPSGEIQLTITIPQTSIQKTYDEVEAEMAKAATIPGFRKGKAPKKLVEEKIDKEKVYEQVLQKIVPQTYIEAIQEHKLKPIIAPKVELLKAKEGEDWEIRATTCERPQVVLKDYKDELKKALAPSKLWTPKTEKPAAAEVHPPVGEAGKNAENTEDEKTQQIIQFLLQTVKIDLPQILVEDELNRALASLINQTGRLGLTLDQYLTSIGKTAEGLREEYRGRIEEDLKLQLILDEIAKEEKITASDEEIAQLISATGDQKLKEDLNSPHQQEYLRGILARRKTLDFLTKL